MAQESIIQKREGFHLREHAGLLLIVTGVILVLSLLFYNPEPDAGFNLTGTFGRYSASALLYLFGGISHIVGPYLILIGIEEMRRGISDPVSRLLALILMLFSGSVLLFLSGVQENAGITGNYLGIALFYLFGHTGSGIISTVILISALMFASGRSLSDLISRSIVLTRALMGSLSGRARGQDDRGGRGSTDSGAEAPSIAPAARIEGSGDRGERMEMPMGANRESDRQSVSVKYWGEGIAMKTGGVVRILSEEMPWFEKRCVDGVASAPPVVPHSDAPIHPTGPIDLAEEPSPAWSAPATPDMEALHARLREKRNAMHSPEFRSGGADVKTGTPLFRGVFSPDGKTFRFAGGVGEAFADEPEMGYALDGPPGGIIAEPSVDCDPVSVEEREGLEGLWEERRMDTLREDDLEDRDHIDLIEEGASIEEMASDDDGFEREEDGESAPREERASRFATPRAAAPPLYDLPPIFRRRERYYIPPEILNLSQRTVPEDLHRELDETREILERVMRDYGVLAKVVHIQRGPIITMYEIRPEPGVKVSKIIGIYDELKMNLEAASLRIIAPIPGKSTIGIEIPNRRSETVRLGDIIRLDSHFFSSTRELPIILGKDITGENTYIDLTKLPHLLIAGATGAGKSVYMNVIISSLLYARSPERVRFIMIDPKMVELKLFEGIPHLLMPVITDVRKAGKALNWTIQEMERRYMILSGLKCRDIRSYNERAKEMRVEEMPYIVLLIDELSDLMMVSGKEVEDAIIRLTQKARAVGIHVIMATQRPSVDVITALIKANCPARISFQVAQKTDARTILDMNGSETLMGRGDMLYRSPTASGLKRMQAPLITEAEIEKIVGETARYGEPAYVELPEEDSENDDGGSGDEIDSGLIQEAWRIIQESGKTSTSYIQRRLKIGYNRAANIVEILEDRGNLSPPIGNKPREILKRS